MTQKTEIADRDLMAFFDDELDEDEMVALEARLDGNEEAQSKLADLAFVASILQEEIEGDTRGDGIADAVMARLDAADVSDEDVTDEDVTDEDGADDAGESAEAEDRVRLKKGPVLPQTTATPANDNSRTVWTFAGVAAAVAAGLFVWGNTGVEADPTAFAPRQPTAEVTPAEPVAPAPETLGEVADVSDTRGGASDEDEDAVEIAQLDFGEGEHTGSIFKVDNDNTGVHTAVVWVTDSGEDE